MTFDFIPLNKDRIIGQKPLLEVGGKGNLVDAHPAEREDPRLGAV